MLKEEAEKNFNLFYIENLDKTIRYFIYKGATKNDAEELASTEKLWDSTILGVEIIFQPFLIVIIWLLVVALAKLLQKLKLQTKINNAINLIFI